MIHRHPNHSSFGSLALDAYVIRLEITVRGLVESPNNNSRATEVSPQDSGPPWDQNAFDLGFFGWRQLLREKPNIGGKRMRLRTAKDEKISSKSMF